MDVAGLLAELLRVFAPGWWAAHAAAILNIIVIDVVLAGDNAIVVGLAASRVDTSIRNKVIFWGIAAAVALRIAFAGITTKLLLIIGLTLAGGLLLLWVSWKMYRQVSQPGNHDSDARAANRAAGQLGFTAAVWQITIADVSMSLDNVLAVAGAAKGSPLVLAVGLLVAIVLMALASRLIADLLVRWPWITWIGLAIIVWVAIDMIYRGSHEVTCQAIQVGCSETLLEGLQHRLDMLLGRDA
jgi:YjbE family integral membrane protein